MSQAVYYRQEGGVATITLGAAESGNPLNASLLAGLRHGLGEAEGDPACRVIVLAARGPHFCTGLDFEMLRAEGDGSVRALLQGYLDCLTRLTSSPLPSIACVEGQVTGGGLGLVAACDVVLALDQAVFMLSEVIVGMIPALIAPFLLRRLTPGRLRYLALSSRGVRGEEARAYGLVDELVTGRMEPALRRQLRRLLRSSPQALAQSKRYLEALPGENFGSQQDMALAQSLAWLSQPEVVEHLQRFAEGCAPPWFQTYRTPHRD